LRDRLALQRDERDWVFRVYTPCEQVDQFLPCILVGGMRKRMGVIPKASPTPDSIRRNIKHAGIRKTTLAIDHCQGVLLSHLLPVPLRVLPDVRKRKQSINRCASLHTEKTIPTYWSMA
jgi:hypothetical protein